MLAHGLRQAVSWPDMWACSAQRCTALAVYAACLLTSALRAQARASQQQGTLVHRELHKQAYNDALVQRYQHLPDVKRIQRHRHLPTPLYKVRCVLCLQILLLNTVRLLGHSSRSLRQCARNAEGMFGTPPLCLSCGVERPVTCQRPCASCPGRAMAGDLGAESQLGHNRPGSPCSVHAI